MKTYENKQQFEKLFKKGDDELIKLMDKSKTIIIEDLSEFDPDKSGDGGGYSFHTIYKKMVPFNCWYLVYGTSSILEYCNLTGNFSNCYNCIYFDGICNCKPKIVSNTELFNTIKQVIDEVMKFDGKYYVLFK